MRSATLGCCSGSPHVPSAPALPADHQGPETARDRRGHAADRPLHPDLLAGCGPPEKDGGEVQHGGKRPAPAEAGSLPGCPRGAS